MSPLKLRPQARSRWPTERRRAELSNGLAPGKYLGHRCRFTGTDGNSKEVRDRVRTAAERQPSTARHTPSCPEPGAWTSPSGTGHNEGAFGPAGKPVVSLCCASVLLPPRVRGVSDLSLKNVLIIRNSELVFRAVAQTLVKLMYVWFYGLQSAFLHVTLSSSEACWGGRDEECHTAHVRSQKAGH